MQARLQQRVTASLLLLSLGWFVGWARAGRPLLGLAGAVLIAMGYALVLGLEFVLLQRVHGDDPTPRASGRQLLKAWWG